MSSISFITALLSFGTLVADVALALGVIWFIIDRNSLRPLLHWVGNNALELGLIAAALATLGSLFFSNVVGYAPCELCWWQRIFLYPQVVLFAVALVYRIKNKPLGPTFSVSGVLSLLSLGIGLFQYYGATWNPSALAGCAATGVSCAKTYFTEFGFVTMPVMAVTIALLLLAIVASRRYAHS